MSDINFSGYHREQEGEYQERTVKVSTTSDKRETLESIARELVGQKLAACAQISGPITSIYRWKGEVETSQEWVLTAKTIDVLLRKIQPLVDELHHYEVPEFVVEEIVASDNYYAWLLQSLK